MKRITFFILFSVLYFLSGCLGYRAVEWRIQFNDDFKGGKVTVTFEDLTSEELNFFPPKDSSAVQKAERIRWQKKQDFKQLLETYQGDQFLLDGVDMGIYIKERRLYEKDGKLFGSFSGVFTNLKPDEEVFLKINKDAIIVTLQNDRNVERIETDGHKVVGEEETTITWPKTKHNIYWKVVLKKEKPELSHSLVDEFRLWENGKKYH